MMEKPPSIEDNMILRRADIGVISAFKLAGVLLLVLVPLGGVHLYVIRGEIERAVLMNNAIMAERYVTKGEQEAMQKRLEKRLEEIQSQLEANRRLAERVAIRLKVEP